MARRVILAAWLIVASATAAAAQTPHVISIRGHDQVLRLYGSRDGEPVILSSGDGGWIHLAPHVAEALSARGFFVVGFDVRAYLAGFTSRSGTLRIEDEPGDYKVLIDFATLQSGRQPMLIGVSEGAGLSVLAAADPQVKRTVRGVIGLGLSDLTELGWRWRDMVIYLTHGSPDEPGFNVKAVVDRLAPLPFAAIHSTNDEYASLADVEQVLGRARQPKRLWIVRASDHRFSGNLAGFDRTLLDALSWVRQVSGGGSR